MDAVTSFELEAQRRRETVAIDRRDVAWAHADAAWTDAAWTDAADSFETARVERAMPSDVPVRLTDRIAAPADCQPARATR
jgi:hypothetical protein